MLQICDWNETGLDLLEAMNTVAQKRYLGGPETPAKLLDRHQRYLTYHQLGRTEMLRIVVEATNVGSIGYWETYRGGHQVYEAGWEILQDQHGRGIASLASRMLLDRLQSVAVHRELYAFPAPSNTASNALCQKLGFHLMGVEDMEYPIGVIAPHNVWCLDLASRSRPTDR